MRMIFLGDIHGFARRLPLRHWFDKSLAGWLNMRLNPNRKFNFDLWPQTLQYIRGLDPDWVLCSGDLTQLSLPAEFQKVLLPWRALLPGPRTLIVPGNHDRYTQAAARRKVFEHGVGDWAPASYPWCVQLVEGWHLLALDSTSPQTLNATGEVGAEQLRALRERLSHFTQRDGVLLLTHYPMLLPETRQDKPGHLLRDAAELGQVLSRSRARLIYLHGHVHEPWSWRCTDPSLSRLHCLNAGCPTRCSDAFPQGQGFWELRLPCGKKDPGVEIRRHCRRQGQWQVRRQVILQEEFPARETAPAMPPEAEDGVL